MLGNDSCCIFPVLCWYDPVYIYFQVILGYLYARFVISKTTFFFKLKKMLQDLRGGSSEVGENFHQSSKINKKACRAGQKYFLLPPPPPP